jgi:hypothetical protein
LDNNNSDQTPLPESDPNVITLIDDDPQQFQDNEFYEEEDAYYDEQECGNDDFYDANDYQVNMILQNVPSEINNFTRQSTNTTLEPSQHLSKRPLINSESVLADSGANAIVLNRMPDGVTNSKMSRASILFANDTKLAVSTEATMGTLPISVSSELRENVISLGKLADNNYVSIIDKNNITVLKPGTARNFSLSKSSVATQFSLDLNDCLYRLPFKTFWENLGFPQQPDPDQPNKK